MALRKLLDSLEPLFTRGGKLEKYYSLFEMVDTLLYSPPERTPHAPHARDALDLKRVMGYVWLATFPVMFMACFNNISLSSKLFFDSLMQNTTPLNWSDILQIATQYEGITPG